MVEGVSGDVLNCMADLVAKRLSSLGQLVAVVFPVERGGIQSKGAGTNFFAFILVELNIFNWGTYYGFWTPRDLSVIGVLIISFFKLCSSANETRILPWYIYIYIYILYTGSRVKFLQEWRVQQCEKLVLLGNMSVTLRSPLEISETSQQYGSEGC